MRKKAFGKNFSKPAQSSKIVWRQFLQVTTIFLAFFV